MLERYFDHDRAEVLRSHLAGPHLDSFASALTQAGYAPSTARTQLRLLADLGEWLLRSKRTAADLDQNAVDAFLAARRRHHRRHRVDRPTLHHFIEHLHLQGVVAMPPVLPPEETPMLKLEWRYEDHLRKERGLKAKTIKNHWPLIRRFLWVRFGHEPLRVAALQAADVSRFMLNDTRHMGAQYAQAMAGALRSFFRFLVREGETLIDLAGSVPTIPCWRNATLPKYLSDVEVEQLLASCDRTTPVGRRDHAVLLLLARLGLRAGEVAGLQLDEIDWRLGEIRVLGKGQIRDRLPLLPEIGQALVAYLRRDRPSSSARHVFLRAKAPQRGFASANAVSTIVRRAIERASLQPPFKGAHILRHTLATRLLRSGASMAEVAEVLRHRNTVTTEIYAKVDIRSLRALAPPWVATGRVR